MAKKKKNKKEVRVFSELENDIYIKTMIKKGGAGFNNNYIQPLKNILANTDIIKFDQDALEESLKLKNKELRRLVTKTIEQFDDIFNEVLISFRSENIYVRKIAGYLVIQFIIRDTSSYEEKYARSIKEFGLASGLVTSTMYVSADKEEVLENDEAFKLGIINNSYAESNLSEIEKHLIQIGANNENTQDAILYLFYILGSDMPKLAMEAVIGGANTKHIKLNKYGLRRELIKQQREEILVDLCKKYKPTSNENLNYNLLIYSGINTFEQLNEEPGLRSSRLNWNVQINKDLIENVDEVVVDTDVLIKRLTELRTNENLITKFKEMVNLPQFFSELIVREKSKTEESPIHRYSYVDNFLIAETISQPSLSIATMTIIDLDRATRLGGFDANIMLGCDSSDISTKLIADVSKKIKRDPDLLYSLLQETVCNITLIYDYLQAARENNRVKESHRKNIIEPTDIINENKTSNDADTYKKKVENAEEERVDIIKKKYTLSSNIFSPVQFNLKRKGFLPKMKRAKYREHNVMGYWRHYKSGKKTWINPHVRGTGGKIKKEITLTQ